MRSITTLRIAMLSLSLGIVATAAGAGDPASDLKSKDVRERLAAIAAIAKDGHPQADKLLLKTVNDKDLEVAHRAVEALETLAVSGAAKGLLEVALEYPVRITRLAAARALARIDAADAAKRLTSKLSGSGRVPAAEALAVVADPSSAKVFEKLLSSEEPEVRVAAVVGLGRIGGGDSHERLVKLLQSTDSVTAAAAAQALADTGTRASLDALLARLAASQLSDVMQRRVLSAAATILSAWSGAERDAGLSAVESMFTASATAAARAARLLGRMSSGDPGDGAARAVEILIKAGLGHDAEEARRAAVAALGDLGDAAGFDPVAERLRSDKSASVRRRSIEALAAIDPDKASEEIAAKIGDDAEWAVREQAAVVCGQRHWTEAAPALRAALADGDWRVVLAASISLGSIQDRDAIEPLQALYAGGDWRARATSIAGLGRIGMAEVIPFLIAALKDDDPTVQATAHDFLKRICFTDQSPDVRRWEKWWTQNESKFNFFDRNQRYSDAIAERYAYRDFKREPYGALSEIAVFVLGGGKDALQVYLEKLSIGHQMTLPGKVNESAIQPNAVFIANCPGNIQGEDAERLDWFVRSGGYMFATCWGLTRTVAALFPGVIHADRGQSDADSVDAEAADLDSRFLQHVIEPDTMLEFRLAGYQIIVIDDPERFHVLIDSVEADSRWGQGILCGWFAVGHGVVVDSTNHFNQQGMSGVNLPNERDRMAYAFERLGYSYERLRELQDEGVFKSDKKASERCDDQTFMRLLGRFVHEKRKLDG